MNINGQCFFLFGESSVLRFAVLWCAKLFYLIFLVQVGKSVYKFHLLPSGLVNPHTG